MKNDKRKTKLLVENWRKLIEIDQNVIDLATPIQDDNYYDLQQDEYYADDLAQEMPDTQDISDNSDVSDKISQIIECLIELNCDKNYCNELRSKLKNCDSSMLDVLCRCLTICLK